MLPLIDLTADDVVAVDLEQDKAETLDLEQESKQRNIYIIEDGPPVSLVAAAKCGICLETVQPAAAILCGHIFCFECINQVVRQFKS